MSFLDFILNPETKAVAAEVREFVKNEVDPKYIKAMDRDEVRFPREVYEKFVSFHLTSDWLLAIAKN
jgi:hypothetical protein